MYPTRIQMFPIFFILFSLQYSFHPSSSIGIYLFWSFKYWKFYIAAYLLHKTKGCQQPSNQNFQSPTFIKLLDGPFSVCHMWLGYTHMYYFKVRCPNHEWIMYRPSIFLHTHQTHWDICPSSTHVNSNTQEVRAQGLHPLTHLRCHHVATQSVFLQNASAIIHKGGNHYVQVLG
jgi:hypothetical protein